jgi:hypothetical protein
VIYEFNLMKRASSAHPDDPIDPFVTHTYVRITVEAASDVDALREARVTHPEKAWRLVNLYLIRPQ